MVTVREYLIKNVGKRVKIGAYRGSSFLYADEITDKTLDTIQMMSDKQYKKIIDNLERLRAKKAELEAFGDMASQIEEWKPKFTAAGEMREIIRICSDKYKSSSRQTSEQLRRAESIVKIWEPYLDRQIMEKYKSINEYQTMIVLITGIETGNFWTIKEYRQSKEGGEEDVSDGSGGTEAEDQSTI